MLKYFLFGDLNIIILSQRTTTFSRRQVLGSLPSLDRVRRVTLDKSFNPALCLGVGWEGSLTTVGQVWSGGGKGQSRESREKKGSKFSGIFK